MLRNYYIFIANRSNSKTESQVNVQTQLRLESKISRNVIWSQSNFCNPIFALKDVSKSCELAVSMHDSMVASRTTLYWFLLNIKTLANVKWKSQGENFTPDRESPQINLVYAGELMGKLDYQKRWNTQLCVLDYFYHLQFWSYVCSPSMLDSIFSNNKSIIIQWWIQGDSPRRASPTVRNFSISNSFSENLIKICWRPAHWKVGGPSYGNPGSAPVI